MCYFTLSFYPIDFKPWHYDTYVLRFIGMLFFKTSQLLYRIYSGFSGSLCVDRCLLNSVHVGRFSIYL